MFFLMQYIESTATVRESWGVRLVLHRRLGAIMRRQATVSVQQAMQQRICEMLPCVQSSCPLMSVCSHSCLGSKPSPWAPLAVVFSLQRARCRASAWGLMPSGLPVYRLKSLSMRGINMCVARCRAHIRRPSPVRYLLENGCG